MLGVAGTGLALGAVGLHRREQLELADYLDGAQWLSSTCVSGAKELIQSALPTKAEARAIVVQLQQPQPKLKPRLQAWGEQMLEDQSWFEAFTKRSKIVCGSTGSGKTTYQLYDVAKFKEEHPDGHLLICDLDYGSSHEGSEPNYWFNLPKDEYIACTYQEVLDALLDENEELERRASASREGKAKPWQWRMLVIDELIAVMEEAKSAGQLKVVQSAVRNLLYRGLKQRIKVTFGVQVLAVGENGLNLAMQEQTNILILGPSAVRSRNISSLGVDNPQELIDKLKHVRTLPGCQFAAIARIGADVGIKVVPHIDPAQIQVVQPETDELEQWWQQVYTPEAEQWLKDLADRHLSGEIKSPLKTEICKRFGVQKFVKSDPKYAKVSEAWNQAKQSVQLQLAGANN